MAWTSWRSRLRRLPAPVVDAGLALALAVAVTVAINVSLAQGEPIIDLTVRPWTTEQLDQARHPTDLVPGDRIWVNLDLAQQGIGSASCGPGVLPAYRLDPRPVGFAVRLLPLP